MGKRCILVIITYSYSDQIIQYCSTTERILIEVGMVVGVACFVVRLIGIDLLKLVADIQEAVGKTIRKDVKSDYQQAKTDVRDLRDDLEGK